MAKTDEELDKALKAELAASGHPVLSNEELAKAKLDARAAIDKERKAAAVKQVVAEETQRLRREEGFMAGDVVKDEIVKMTIDLPEYTDRLIINQAEFFHGYTYEVPRHVANSMRETMQKAWNHQNEIDGKTVAQNINMRREVTLSGTKAN